MPEPRHSIEGSSRSTATPEQAWALWTDPSVWPGGPIETAELHGAFEVGGKITTRVKGNRPITTTITRMDEPHLWVGEAKWPGLRMAIEHVIDPVEGGVLLTERSIFSGPFAGLAARLLRRRVESIYAATTAHAAEVAQAPAKADSRSPDA
jgi:polyketide cyclase/dehydrase/lipid transport protein